MLRIYTKMSFTTVRYVLNCLLLTIIAAIQPPMTSVWVDGRDSSCFKSLNNNSLTIFYNFNLKTVCET